jgi:hypothetical protein
MSPTKFKLSGAIKIDDIIISRFQGRGVAFCYVSVKNLTTKKYRYLKHITGQTTAELSVKMT